MRVNPKGRSRKGGPSPSGEYRARAVAPGHVSAYIFRTPGGLRRQPSVALPIHAVHHVIAPSCIVRRVVPGVRPIGIDFRKVCSHRPSFTHTLIKVPDRGLLRGRVLHRRTPREQQRSQEQSAGHLSLSFHFPYWPTVESMNHQRFSAASARAISSSVTQGAPTAATLHFSTSW